jgi:hypothetical protein
MSTSVVQDILLLLEDGKDVLGLPSWLQMDRLPEKGDGISVQMAKTPKILRQYITGKSKQRATFEVLARTTELEQTSSANLTATNWLEAIGALFSGMHDFVLSETRTITSGEVTSPSIVTRTDGNRITYSITVEIEFTEE